ncbi:MAG: hypothetical protein IIX77_01925, partial [Oscillospiraceae bacterium]|nr:hypothetical protein [Oscillospiraceae bacterium]
SRTQSVLKSVAQQFAVLASTAKDFSIVSPPAKRCVHTDSFWLSSRKTRPVSNPNITRHLKKFVFPPPLCYDIPIPPKGEHDYEQ